MLYLITKLQNLKAIHNRQFQYQEPFPVVSNYKITKSESYSQLLLNWQPSIMGCI